ncbi:MULTISPECIES: MarR family winged helix-turn-helix transcriptional regulator [Sphingobium]|uniref:MarR-family transcriptional regulator n=3 Tax=Sphingobium indicum TaxID=332055 RepID=D4YX93_SPHIU|nr:MULTISPECIES: MarR family winged helix-turn-helix transcriptional regulator [Sphingobium]KEZ00034.1 MarR family transcriptional regulator [Sphingomonas sp. BHC-A]APL95726.1 MarR family transcriptional regulator [Sphingobium indicum B90A]EQB01559.1 MarR family transcriptional regulator [Sphingobium sp. HDIP04]NYI23944.1 DNA-binding MarR family transcriptional regulator [Sphingobium indicum]RYM00094.1 MarR family transcriptional regulator [Sphingobium indicum]
MRDVDASLLSAQHGLDCTCFRLRQATRRVSQIYDSYLGELDLKNTQFTLLAHLTLKEFTIGELADWMVIDPTTLNRNLRYLQERGLIESAPGERDRRERCLKATPAGRDLYKQAVPYWKAAQAAIRKALSRETSDQLHSVLLHASKLDLPEEAVIAQN